MKPLTLILLLAISVQAQTLAEIARKERERQAALKPTVVVVGAGASTVSTGATKPASKPQEVDAPATEKKATPPLQKPAIATPAPSLEYDAQLEKLRSRIRELQDQETSLQFQLNLLTNQIFAPVTDQASKDQAQARLGEVQQKLTSLRVELDLARKALDAMQLQGPPKR